MTTRCKYALIPGIDVLIPRPIPGVGGFNWLVHNLTISNTHKQRTNKLCLVVVPSECVALNDNEKGILARSEKMRASRGWGVQVPLFPLKINSCFLVRQKWIKVVPEIHLYWVPMFPEIVLHVPLIPQNIPLRTHNFSHTSFSFSPVRKRLACYYF